MKRFCLIATLSGLPILANAFPIASTGEGLEVLAGGNAPVIATYQGNSASYSNDLYLMLDASGNSTDDGILGNDLLIFNNHSSPVGSTVNLGSFAIGSELMFRLHVNNTGIDYVTGDASRNPDNHAHARVQENWLPNETLVSFEDLYSGPFDYNDLSFSFTNTISSAAVTESDSITLLLMGLVGLIMASQRKGQGKSKHLSLQLA